MKLIWKLAAVLALVTLGMTAAYFVASPAGAGPGGGGGQGNCLVGSTKLDFSAESYTIVAPAGSVITTVSIKAGTECIIYTSDSSGPCYTVSGIGTSTVTVTRIGSGPSCKQISHIEYLTGPGTTTTTTSSTTVPTTTSSSTTTPSSSTTTTSTTP